MDKACRESVRLSLCILVRLSVVGLGDFSATTGLFAGSVLAMLSGLTELADDLLSLPGPEPFSLPMIPPIREVFSCAITGELAAGVSDGFFSPLILLTRSALSPDLSGRLVVLAGACPPDTRGACFSASEEDGLFWLTCLSVRLFSFAASLLPNFEDDWFSIVEVVCFSLPIRPPMRWVFSELTWVFSFELDVGTEADEAGFCGVVGLLDTIVALPEELSPPCFFVETITGVFSLLERRVLPVFPG